jgi:hypothetical protein
MPECYALLAAIADKAGPGQRFNPWCWQTLADGVAAQHADIPFLVLGSRVLPDGTDFGKGIPEIHRPHVERVLLRVQADIAATDQGHATACVASETTDKLSQLGNSVSDDFRSANWNGKVYDFSVNQALCVKVLYDHWKRGGLAASAETIMDAASVNSNQRLDIVFRHNPAWGTMIVRGATKGTYRLAMTEQLEPKKNVVRENDRVAHV